MGKNNAIKSLSKIIANIALHKLVFAHTNKPESKHFLESEIIEYRSVAQNTALKFNWNDFDKKKIYEFSLKILKDEKNTKYSDVEFSDKEAELILSETINDLL